MDFRPLLEQNITLAEDLEDPAQLAGALLQAAYAGGIGLYVWEPLNGRLLWNEAMYRVYGIDRARFGGTVADWLATLHPDDLPRVSQDVADALSGVRPYDTVFRVRRPDGVCYVHGTAWITRDDNGQPVRMAGINQDVTEQQRFQMLVDAIRSGTSHEVGLDFLQSLARALARALSVKCVRMARLLPGDPGQYQWLTGNEAALQADMPQPLAHSMVAWIGQRGEAVEAQQLRERFPDDPWVQKGGYDGGAGVALRGPEGEVIGALVALDAVPLADAELARKLLRLFADRASAELARLIEDERVKRRNAALEAQVAARTAELREALQELEAFTYAVSHDLSTPLRAVQGFAAALRHDYSTRLDDTGRDYLDRMQSAAERMRGLLDELVNLSKISLRPLTLGRVNLTRIARAVAQNLALKHPHPARQVTVADDLLTYGDEGLLRLMIDRLLRNAWQATAGLEVPRIEVGAALHQGRPSFYVRDNGRGLTRDEAERVFHMLRHQSGPEVSGLAIVKRILFRLHGGISAEGEAGCGATFWFWLPSAADFAAQFGERSA
jgi:PAS domain S-box-containing protein